jgi:hypothetical protein
MNHHPLQRQNQNPSASNWVLKRTSYAMLKWFDEIYQRQKQKLKLKQKDTEEFVLFLLRGD